MKFPGILKISCFLLLFAAANALADTPLWIWHNNVPAQLKKGENVIAIRALNVLGDQAGVVATLEMRFGKQRSTVLVTDEQWVSSAREETGWNTLDFKATGWTRVASRGKLGDKPWGDVLKLPKATPAESLTTIP